MIIERYVTAKETSEITGKPEQTLTNERYKCTGIPYIKLKRSVRYKISDIHNYMEAHRIDPESRNN